jgi:Concanavalin A-like lectin/glucanases superfamily
MAITDNCVGYWKLDEAITSGPRNDSSGHGHTLTDLLGNVPYAYNAAEVKIGYSTVWSYANECLYCNNHADFVAGTGTVSMAGWAKFYTSANRPLIIKANATATLWDYTLYTDGSGALSFYVDLSGGGNLTVVGPTMATGTWYFLYAFYDPTTTTIGLSVNAGTPVTLSLGPSLALTTTGDFGIGGHPSGGWQFNGWLDEWGFWRRTLTSTELTQLYNGGAGTTYPFLSLTDNCVAYWKLDEASGIRVDATGNTANNLTESAGTITGDAGKIGNGLHFDPAYTGYLGCASNSSLVTGDINFSISCWVNFDALGVGSSYFLVSRRSSDERWDYGIFKNTDDRIYFLLTDTGGTHLFASYSPIVSASTWYHMAVVYNATTDEIKTFTNNVLNGTVATPSLPPQTTSAPFTIGNLDRGGAATDGIIDEVGIWKRCLNEGDIAALYNGGVGLTYPFGVVPIDNTARNKRAATIGIDGIYRMVLPVPDGTINATDRWQVTGKYRMTAAPPAALIFRNRTASRLRVTFPF